MSRLPFIIGAIKQGQAFLLLAFSCGKCGMRAYRDPRNKVNHCASCSGGGA